MKIKSLKTVLFACCCLAPLASCAMAQQGVSPLPTDVLPNTKILGVGIALSPDGQWVAYPVRDLGKTRQLDKDDKDFPRLRVSALGRGCDIWITNTRTGESKNLTANQGANWNLSWSPDGKYLAFYSDITGKPQLWVWEKSSGRSRPVSDAIVYPRFSADVAEWTADGHKVLVKTLPEGMSLEDAAKLDELTQEQLNDQTNPTGANVSVYSSLTTQRPDDPAQGEVAIQPTAITNLFLADLAMIDISSGRVRRVARGFNPCWYRTAPDGARVALLTAKGRTEDNAWRNQFDLVVISLADGSSRIVANNIESIGIFSHTVSWSPDGKSLSFIDNKPGAPGECYLVSLTGGAPRKATDARLPSFFNLYRAPLWDRAGKSIYLLGGDAVWRISLENRMASEVAKIPSKNLIGVVSPRAGGRFSSPDGGRSMIVITRDDATKQSGFYQVDLTTGKFSKLLEENKGFGALTTFNLDASDDRQSIVYAAQDAQHPYDIWFTDYGFQRPRRLTRINPELDRYAMGTTRLIEWRSVDGQRLRAALLLPPDYQEGKRYPLIVNVYGGDLRSNEANDFGLGALGALSQNMQLLATRGYVVLSPDAPLRAGTPMQDIAKTVLPGVDKAIELGIADPDRLGVMGRSYGGYSTLALITQTARFKAAVSWAGYGSALGIYGVMRKDGTGAWSGWSETASGRMGGTPWEYRERYIENSPFFYLDRVQTPLLIAHGSKDTSVPAYLSEEVFIGLRRLGKKVVYAKYDGEGHVIFKHANQVDFWNRLIAWFDEHLTPRSGQRAGDPSSPLR